MKSKFFIYGSSVFNMDLIALINVDLNENNVEIFLKDGYKINSTMEDINDFGKKLYEFVKENNND